MIDHATARAFTSARFDGELDPALEAPLAEHLAGCAECGAYADGLAGLRALARSLPGERAPDGFASRVSEAIPPAGPPAPRPEVRRRALWRVAPALAAALVVALVAVILQPVTRFALPAAEAAEALIRIRTLFVEREVVRVAQPELGVEGATTIERLWFRAPGLLRLERTSGAGPPEVFIARPGETYEPGGIGRIVGLPPDPDVPPEPLSPTIALLGRPSGPGPVVAGRPTTRFVIDFGDDRRREAFVDTARFLSLETEELLVLGKGPAAGVRPGIVKRVRRVTVNQPLAASLFAVPDVAAIDRGFRARPPRAIAGAPSATPAGFELVLAGQTADGTATLQYGRGAAFVTVRIGEALPPEPGPTELRRAVRVGAREATLSLDLYRLPRISFASGGRQITIAAPLPPDRLADLAAAMYPA